MKIGLSCLMLVMIAVSSWHSIPQIVFLDEALTEARFSKRPLRFADYASAAGNGTTVLRYRYFLAALSIAAPLAAVGAMFLHRWPRLVGLFLCFWIVTALEIYVGIAIVFAT